MNITLKSQSFESDFKALKVKVELNEDITSDYFEAIIKKHQNQFDKFPDLSAEMLFYYANELVYNNDVEKGVDQLSKAYNYSLKARDTTLKYQIVLSFARISSQIKNYEKAEAYFRYALPGIAAIYGASHITYTEIYYEYIQVLIHQRKYEEALPLLEGLVYYYETLGLTNTKSYLNILGNQGQAYQELGQYKKASDKYFYLSKDDKLVKLGDTTGYIITIMNLGDSYRHLDMHQNALKTLLKAHSEIKNLNLINYDLSASIHNQLGLLYKALNNFSKSEAYFKEAIYIYKQHQSIETEQYCTFLSNKADLMRLLGRQEEALDLLNQALTIRKNKFSDQTYEYANALSNYGLVLFDGGDFKPAQLYFEAALKIYEKVISKTHEAYANCLNNLSGCYFESKMYKEAEEYKFKAMKIIEETLGKSSFKYISFTNGVVNVLVQNKEFEKALEFLDESKNLAKQKFGVNHSLYYYSLFNSAVVYLQMKDYKKSISIHEEVLELKLKEIDSYFFEMNLNDQAVYLQEIQWMLDSYSEALFNFSKGLNTNDFAASYKKHFNYQLALRSLLNRSSTEFQRYLSQITDPKLKHRYLLLVDLKNDLNNLYKSDFSMSEQAHLLDSIKSIELSLRKKLNMKQHHLNDFEEVKNKLALNEAAICINWYYEYSSDTVSTRKYTAYVIKKNMTFPLCVFLNQTNFKENDALAAYENSMENVVLDTVSYLNFYKPLENAVSDCSRLYVSNAGVYHKINLQTLYNTKAKHYLVETKDIVYVPSLTTLLKAPLTNTVFTAELYGNPDFNYDFIAHKTSQIKIDSNLIAKRFGLQNINDLPGTEVELNNIEILLKEAKWMIKKYTRSEANETNLRLVKSPKVLHLATHGYFLEDVEEGERKILGYNSKAFEQLSDVRSGLIFAGAAITTNDTAKISSIEDGLLPAREAALLDLSNTDLVVLSACQTGLGFETNNQGVLGLQQAFSNAGAKNLILSLWPVDDMATQKLMSKFYSYWLKNGSTETISEAFRSAQRDLMKEYKHPYFWGAFTLLRN